MCNFWARVEWIVSRRDISYYLYVDTVKYKYHILNPTPLYCTTGYII